MATADLERVEPQKLRRKSTAAIEWRTIPPTIKVRHKKRPPPITIHSKRSFEQLVWTPGPTSSSTPATTATTASSATIFTPLTSSAPTFREFSTSATAGQEPRIPFYATPGFQQSPNGPDDIKAPAWPLPINKLVPQVGKTALEVVTELDYVPVGADDSEICEVPSPPLSPTVHLTLHPWTLPEYLLLLSIKPLCSKNDDISWDEVASKLNVDTRYPQRSAWDCWHRWIVPWCRSQHTSKPRRNTYPHAPGVQHEYKFADLEGLLELWASVSGAMGISHGVAYESPHAFPAPKTAAIQPRRAWGRAHHPGAHSAHLISCARFLWAMSHEAYPPHSAPPNVPSRTLGDACERGLAPWFTISAINTPVLQRILESQPDRTENWLPPHLRGRMVPQPLSSPMGATPDSG